VCKWAGSTNRSMSLGMGGAVWAAGWGTGSWPRGQGGQGLGPVPRDHPSSPGGT
jgi:hypothetical protein